MEDNKKRVADDVANSGSPKKQRVSKKLVKGRKRDPNSPKRPKTAYFFYLDHVRWEIKNDPPEDPPKTIGEIAKYAGKKWRGMTDQQKEPFKQQHQKAKDTFDELMKQCKPNSTRDSEKPKKPRSAFFIFLKEFREKMKNVQLPEGKIVPSMAGEEWRKMDAEARKTYNAEADAAKEVYKREMVDYYAKHKDAKEEKPAAKAKAKGKAKPKALVKEASESEEEEEEDDENDDEEEEEEDDEEEDEDDDEEDDDSD